MAEATAAEAERLNDMAKIWREKTPDDEEAALADQHKHLMRQWTH
jgi:hypothetical protein